MKHFNKIACACCSVVLGLLALTGCEDERFYSVNSPDWLSDAIDSSTSTTTEVEDFDGMEDVYTIGETDYSSGWWTAFSKYYQVPDGEEWKAQFTLHINPSAANTYLNFALVICNDAGRDDAGYAEYGVIRYDNQPSGNSEWGDYIDRSYVTSTLTFETDTDGGIENLGGTVTLTVDRTDPEAFTVTMTNGVVTKTYAQPYALENLNADASNTTIRCYLVPEGSYISFLKTNIEPIGGATSSEDKNPVSMVLQNVPEFVSLGADLAEAMADVTAVVTFEEGVTKTVTAGELTFSSIPDMDTTGEKTLVAVYNLTYNGEYCETPIMASATFTVENAIVDLEVTNAPTRTTYYYLTTEATSSLSDRTLAFDPTGMEVTATYEDGTTGVINNSRLTYSTVPATAGTHQVTIATNEGVTATVEVTVAESSVSAVSNSKAIVGAEDNTTGY